MMNNGSHRSLPSKIFNNHDYKAIDLEAIVIAWARQMFDATKTKSESRINRKYLDYNINWRHLTVETRPPTYTIDGVGDIDEHEAAKHHVVLFRTIFTNTTDHEQEYRFKTERTTRSSVTVIVEKGVCRGVEMSMKLKTPCKVIEANAGFSTELSLKNIGENNIEEVTSSESDGVRTIRLTDF